MLFYSLLPSKFLLFFSFFSVGFYLAVVSFLSEGIKPSPTVNHPIYVLNILQLLDNQLFYFLKKKLAMSSGDIW